MDADEGLTAKWRDYRPSKKLWGASCVATAAVTVAVGFSGLGWVTRETADEMAAQAATQARAKLVARACVEHFASGDQFASRFQRFKKASPYERERMIEEGDWIRLPWLEKSVSGAADRCADRLADLESTGQPSATTGGTQTERS